MTAKKPFDGFDFEDFRADRPYSLENYVEPPPSDELIASIEQELVSSRNWVAIGCRRPISTSPGATMADLSTATATR
jgi:hypothetical protein